MPAAAHTEFDADELESAYPPGIERQFWTLARCKIIARHLRRLPANGGRLMEIGCGRGIVVADLRARGFDCHGVELAPAEVPSALAPFVSTGIDASDVPETLRSSIQTILFLDVIEHLSDPAGFLTHILGQYPRARHLLVTVPARAELWSNYDEFYRHHRRYDPALLRETFVQARCRPLWIGYAFHALYPAMLLAKARGTGRTTKLKAPTGFAITLHSWLAEAFFLDSVAIPRWIPGTSLLGVAAIEGTA